MAKSVLVTGTTGFVAAAIDSKLNCLHFAIEVIRVIHGNIATLRLAPKSGRMLSDPTEGEFTTYPPDSHNPSLKSTTQRNGESS
jgi:hypothetical protein